MWKHTSQKHYRLKECEAQKGQEVIPFDKKGSFQIKKALNFDTRYLFYELIVLTSPPPRKPGEKKDLFLRNKVRHSTDLIIIYLAFLKVQRAENAKGNIPLHIFHPSNTFGLEVLVAFKDS